MRSISFLILITVMMLYPCGTAFSGEAESFTVNGLKVVFKQNTSSDIVAAGLYFRGGATVLSLNNAGIERLGLAVAIKASMNYPKDQLNAELERMNTRLSSSTTSDYSNITLQCVKQNFQKSWEIFADVILHPKFTEEDVKLERHRLLTSIKQQKDNPDAYLGKLTREAFYLDHPYSIDVSGTEESVTALTSEAIQQHYHSRLKGSQLLLVVVGNTTRAELERMVRKSFSHLDQGSYVASRRAAVEHQAPSLKLVRRELPTNYIMGLYPAPGFGSDDYFVMAIAARVLRERVWTEVRTRRALSYAPSAGIGPNFSNYGSIYVTAVDPDSTIKVMRDEVERMKNQAISDKELAGFINQYLTSYYMNNEMNLSQVALLASAELSGAGYQKVATIAQEIKRVTPADIQKRCKEVMGNFQFVLIGNPSTLRIESFMF